MPVFFRPSGSVAQLLFGLIVCFLTFGAHMLYCPYVDEGNDRLAQLCQVYVEAPHLRGQTPAPRAQLCGHQGPARSPPWVARRGRKLRGLPKSLLPLCKVVRSGTPRVRTGASLLLAPHIDRTQLRSVHRERERHEH
eukprot:5568558-Prymnesium_polylepis.1